MPAGEVFADFVAGWTSGVVGLLVSHPWDTVKVRLQSLHTYKGAVQCINQIIRQETARGFYKGMAAPALTAGFLHSTFFLGYGATLSVVEATLEGDAGKRDHLEQRKDRSLKILILASIAGAVLQWIPSCPIEVIKTRLQIQRDNVYRLRQMRSRSQLIPNLPSSPNEARKMVLLGPIDCMRQTWRYGGLSGFYRGGFTMLFRDCIGFCFYLPVYEVTLRHLTATSPSESRRILASMLAGGLAGIACWWSILPLDVVKSRLQADDLVRPKYTGFWHCAVDAYQQEGWKAFTKGWHVAAVRGFPACACLFLVYEQTLRLFWYLAN